MPSFLQSLFPCLTGGEDQQGYPGDTQTKHHESTPVSQAPGPREAPFYGTDKKLPAKPQPDSTAFELPGSSPNYYEMHAPHVPASPLARPSNLTSRDMPRPSQQSDRWPSSPHSQATTYTPGSMAGSIREYDPDEITPVNSNTRGAGPNMYINVTDAITDRKRMFDRLRKANDADAYSVNGGGSVRYMAPSYATVAPVEMEAPMGPASSEMTAREHARKSSGPKELE